MNLLTAIVTNINDPQSKGKVQIRVNTIMNGVNDSDLPWAIVTNSCQNALTNNIGFSHHNLQVGSQVLVFPVDNSQTWIVMGCIPSYDDRENISDVNNYKFTHPSGLTLETKDSTYVITHPSGGVFTITHDNKLYASGFSQIIFDDPTTVNNVLTVNGPINANAGSSGGGGVTINTPVKVNSTVETTDDITTTSDVIANGISLENHTHSGVSTGDGNTGKPN